ncbi:DUF4349 domain-containing protein [Aerococcaceae bacterium WS4759]|uniref:DUF4349 domain-containing protein n=1 Tax=Fundicoccus ignavus TaxID=2664442 RepID=A0A6I2GHH8_9LACT|nr:DUF4349 domain-containing protein [Fundicoccus ignavus]MRI86154.1 DUF4349 domain-containing protein [Fundicoccus ignavus]
MKRITSILFAAMILTGCGTQSNYSETSQSYNLDTAQVEMERADVTEVGQETTDAQALIHTATVQMQTVTYDETKAALMALIEDSSAQVQYQDEYNQTYYDYATNTQSQDRLYTLALTLRIPQDDFDSLLTALTNGDIAEVTSTSRGSQDVTTSVRDLDIRVESLNARIERLTELLNEAESITDIIEIQNSLDEAIVERDQLLAEQQYLNDQVSRSTITVSLKEVLELGDGVTRQRSFWDELVKALSETGYRAIDVLQQGILTLVFLLPYLLFLVILYLIYRWLIKPILKAIGLKNPFKRKNKEKTANQVVKTNDKEE